jgi:hypothetical protein
MLIGAVVLLVVFALGVLVWDYRAEAHYRLQLKRQANRECIHCGYDLRSGHYRCPECGSGSPFES